MICIQTIHIDDINDFFFRYKIRVATDQAEKNSWLFYIKFLIETNPKLHYQRLENMLSFQLEIINDCNSFQKIQLKPKKCYRK